MREPPPLPSPATYTAAYCEENIYRLARDLAARETVWRVSVLFISNTSKTVALWEQKASNDPSRGFLVVWDYHVVLALTHDEHTPANGQIPCWIYDMDTRLSVPCRAEEYFSRTFLDQGTLDERWRSSFRIVPGQVFLDNFASDRSHMLQATGSGNYIAPPPTYSPIIGRAARERGIASNLMSEFVSMEAESFGTVAGSVENVLAALRSACAE